MPVIKDTICNVMFQMSSLNHKVNIRSLPLHLPAIISIDRFQLMKLRRNAAVSVPAYILLKSILDRYWPDRRPVGSITVSI